MIEKDENTLLEAVARLTPQWLAGFFDGEGCVSVYTLAQNGKPTMKVNITQADYMLLALIALKFKHVSGPNLKQHKKLKSKVWELVWTRQGCEEILLYLKDHVILKRKQVELGLAMLETFPGSGNQISASALARQQEIELTMRQLNGSRVRVDSPYRGDSAEGGAL
jgi:hypothetical protein